LICHDYFSELSHCWFSSPELRHFSGFHTLQDA
jgi:hypothetical protein